MDILELGAIGELVGGVAVIASLIYVGLQVRSNTSATRAASHHGIIDSFNDITMSMVRDPVIGRVFREGNENRAGLSEDERFQFDALLFCIFRIQETLHYQSGLGVAERKLFLEQERGFAAFLFSGTGAREWWRENPYPFGPEFTQSVERLLSAKTVGA